VTASLVLGSRGSALALWQARHVAARLEAAHPGLSVRLEIIKTTGDKILDVPLAKVGGKGLFVKEIEEALLERRIDFAVHSMKDVPAVLPAGLVLAAFSAREDPRDALCTRDGRALDSLPTGARVGTSSLRRLCQLRAMRADLEILPLRGNVDTRLRKLDAGEFDAIVLAAAGLVRLGHASRISQRFDDPEMLPAIAQGVLGIETREDDPLTRSLVAVMHDETAATCVRAERAFLRRLGGGCQVPIAGHATLSGDRIRLQGLVASPSRGDVLRAERSGHAKSAETIGAALAEELLSMGAEQILREIGASAPDAAP
jgi:hydroxymethylbilane synthase